MKKEFYLGYLLIAATFSLNAQSISKNTIGFRLGFGGEISYQKALNDNYRLEINVGIRNNSDYNGFKATGVYQWVWTLEDKFNWYAGAGSGIGNYNTKKNNDAFSDTFIFVAGTIGIEYSFDIPLMISLDLRPEISFGKDNFNDYGNDLGLGIRYQF
jgi:opacity protein-like surface antigen